MQASQHPGVRRTSTYREISATTLLSFASEMNVARSFNSAFESSLILFVAINFHFGITVINCVVFIILSPTIIPSYLTLIGPFLRQCCRVCHYSHIDHHPVALSLPCKPKTDMTFFVKGYTRSAIRARVAFIAPEQESKRPR